ncbi:MAG: gliding motility-associated C-terminal domain-containing protein [Bacteroidales bacterium]|nr:gliding motility-associated C-terminal domain-containing protein [Bacteroidales bacterium]
MKSNIRYFLVVLLGLLAGSVYSQQTIMMNSSTNNRTVNASGCSIVIYDSGGPNGQYSNNENYRLTVCMPSGYRVAIDAAFTSESVNWDYMNIYAGRNTGGTVIANQTGCTTSGRLTEHHFETNSSCVTFVWHTDGSGTYAGFEITVSCIIPCQDYTLVPDITARWNADLNRYEACSNEELGFAFHGNYPNNDAPRGYHQTDQNTTWTWSWIDVNGRHESTGLGQNSFAVDIEPGAYYLNISARDFNGCEEVYDQEIFVVISLPPTFVGTTATPVICPGEVILLEAAVQPPDEWVMDIPEIIVEEHCFEDVVGITQSMCFNYDIFEPGQTIEEISDIESICVQIEHSYLGDLEAWLTCPNGSRMDLFNGYNCSACSWEFLGEPIDNDGLSCQQGVPYTYCFTPNESVTIHNVAANPPSYSFTDQSGTYISNHEYIPAGDYAPTGSWTTLIGCPVNGDWCINILDHLGSDDGTVFSVELHFSDNITPAPDRVVSYQTQFNLAPGSHDVRWEGLNVAQVNAATTTAMPDIPGQYQYTFYATDDFGCTYDTTVNVEVRSYDHPICCILPDFITAGQNTQVCSDRHLLSATPLTEGNEGRWEVVSAPTGGTATFAFQNAPNTSVFVDTYGQYVFRWTEAYRGNFEYCSISSTVEVGFYPMPENTFAYLPIDCFGNSTTITYIGNMTNSGFMGDQATFNWNFDGAVVESGTGMGPYVVHWPSTTGDAAMHHVSLNIDIHGCISEPTTINILEPALLTGSISKVDDICFRACNGSATITASGGTLPYSYSWGSPTNTIQNMCVGNYTVTLTDAKGCHLDFEYEITEPAEMVVDELSSGSANLSCYRAYDGEARIVVTGGTGQLHYMWSDIGVGSQFRPNLGAGIYTVVVTDDNGCTLEREYIITQPEPLVLHSNENSAVCEGLSTNVQAVAVGGTMPYNYHWTASNGDVIGDVQSFETNLDTTTTFSVYATDFFGCQSNTETFMVTVSPKMVIDDIIVTNNSCNNACDGTAELVMHGGIQPYQYLWGSNNYIYRGLCSGLYNVTVVDNIGCDVSSHFIVEEPIPMIANTMSTPASCGNTADGTATINIQGSVPPYTYLWPNGDTTHTINAVPGSYVVTVTDANNCRIEREVEILGPTPIFILPMSNQTICSGQSATLTTQASGGTPNYSYMWGNNGEVISYSNILTVTPTVSSTYTLTVTDANGCTALAQPVEITLNPPLNIRAVTTSYDTICPGSEAIIDVVTEGGNGGPYELTIDGGVIVPAPFSIALDTTTMVHITLSDMCGTTPVTDSILIFVRPKPDSLFTATVHEGCEPFSTTFTPFQHSSNTLWEFGDYQFSDIYRPTHVYNKPGNYSVSLELTDNFGCHYYNTYNNYIKVNPKPKALFESTPELTGMLNSEITFINYSTGAQNYYWFFGDNDSSLFEAPRHIYKKMGTFEIMLVAESSELCRDTTTREITIQNEFSFYAPTSFTPNGDGVNDCFRICGNGITPNGFSLAIYDRWGALVYKTTVYNGNESCESCGEGAWDGTDYGSKINGDAVCKSGIYKWFCSFQDWNGVIHDEQGTVMLIR